MKLSVTMIDQAGPAVPVVFRGRYEDSIKKAAAIGYKNLELHLDNPDTIDTEELVRLCNVYDMKITSIGTGPSYGRRGFSLTSPDEEIRRQAINCVKDHITLATKWNAVVIIGLMKGLVKDSDSVETYLQLLEASLQECMEFAEANGIVLVLEAINRYESDIFNTIGETVDFVKKFNSESLKVHIDTYHINIEESNVLESIQNAKGYIGHVHLADNNRNYPGHGHFNFKELIDTLHHINYEGSLALECTYFPEAEEAAKEGYHFIEKMLKKAII